MKVDHWLKSNVADSRELLDSGYAGAHQAVTEALKREDVQADLARSAHEAWRAAAIGAVVGSVTGYLNEDEKPLLGALAGALVGGGLALGGLMAWGTRRLIAAAAVGAVKHVNSTRDEQWLSRNPVAYG
ncbi:MAG: hypothetical protein ACLQBJ_18720 [Bryobacteraceae bacterium]